MVSSRAPIAVDGRLVDYLSRTPSEGNGQRARDVEYLDKGKIEMIFGRKKMQQKIDPAFALAEFRSEIERAIDEARASGVRHYQLAEVLEQAAEAIKVRHSDNITTRPKPKRGTSKAYTLDRLKRVRPDLFGTACSRGAGRR
jgi:hypothetical protein